MCLKNMFRDACPMKTDGFGFHKVNVIISSIWLNHLWSSVNWYPLSTLNQHLFDISINTSWTPRSILRWHLINVLIATWLTIGRVLIDLCVNWHLMGCLQKLVDSQLTVDQVIECQPRCWWSIDQVLIEGRLMVDQGYWLNISINTQAWMLLVHLLYFGILII